jgi:hypothetical protein
MQYKPIENCHMENAVLGKDLNLGVIGSFFMFSPYGDPLCAITLYCFYR